MRKLTYHYSAVSKQTWFYSGILYLLLMSMVYILVVAYRVEGFYEDLNLTVALLANVAGMAFFYLLSLGHNVCFSEYDEEKIIYKNRLLRSSKTFYYKDASAVIFDKWGIKFYADEQALINKEKPDFYVPFFRDGKIEALRLNYFFRLMKDREKQLAGKEDFKVYKAFKIVPGYGRKWKFLSFAYACLTLLVILNCAQPLAVIMGLIAAH